jgi:squalene-associated FAD-dependent desaturase
VPQAAVAPTRVDVAVVGAGWAGLSAAVRLAQAGRHVRVLDAAPAPGGRAREARLDFGAGPVTLDAGQHLLVGAYRESLALAHLLHDGAPPLERFTLALHDTGGLHRLPAPLHLAVGVLRARGLALADRIAMMRLVTRLRRDGWRAARAETVEQLLVRLHQPAALVERLWSPLCMAALNTVPEQACAQAFAAVLRDTLGAARDASDFVLPRTTLGALIATPAEQWLRDRGVQLRRGATVRAIAPGAHGWQVHTGRDEPALDAAQLVLAVPPHAAARLLAPLCPDATQPGSRVARLDEFAYDAITTVYLAWPAAQVPALPRWIMLRESPSRDEHGQWLFDRGRHGAQRIAAVVISVRARLDDAPVADVAAGIGRQVAVQLGVPPPAAMRTVTEKRATFRCTPDRPRIEVDAFAANLPGLWLAGDYAWPDYPATLEAAVRSGRLAAARALQRHADVARVQTTVALR